MKSSKSLLLAESGIMLAFATILSMIPIVQLPYGGSITAFSMLPIILIAYRRGVKWGLFTALAFSLLQLLLGLNNLSYATSNMAAVAIIVLDYVVAFTVLGFGGLFRYALKSQAGALTSGTLFVCVLRYIAHVISGCTVWAGVSIPSADGLMFSLVYNATYMLPETLVTMVGAFYLSRVLDFRGESITRAGPQAKAPDLVILFSGLAKSLLAIALVTDIALVFSKIQSGETGEFDITQITTVNWTLFAIVTIAAVVLAVAFTLLARVVPVNSKVSLKGLFAALPVVGVVVAAVFDAIFIVMTLREGAPALDAIVQMIIFTLAVIVAAVLVARHMYAKKRT